MDTLDDVRFALRTLRRAPGSTALIVLTLALGIGATTAIFSVVHAVVLRPLPYPDAGRLGVVRFDGQGIQDMAAVTPSNVLDFEEQSRTLDALALFASFDATLTLEDGAMEYVPTAFVTPDLPRLLGITPRPGRHLDALLDVRDEGLGNVLMSEELWQRHFGADAGIVGREIVVNDRRLVVAGIVPRGARLLVGGRDRVDLWSARPPVRERGNVFSLPVLVRLAPGATFAEASAELDAVAERNRLRDFQDEDGRGTYSVVPLHENLVGGVRPALFVLLGAVGFVLLLACANVANLLLVRARGRRHEWAVRRALGAGRGRLVRLGLTESLVLAVLGGALGVVLAGWAVRLLPWLSPDDLPRAADVGVSAPVLVFAAALSVLTDLLFGLLPAWRSSSVRVHDALREGGRGGPERGRLSRVLVAGELAVALTLVVGAGLMLRTFVNLHRVDLGFDPAGLLTFQVPLSYELSRSEQGRLDFGRRLVERLGTLPGVESASLTNIVPLSGGYNSASWAYDDASAAAFGELSALLRRSWPGYFETVGLPILEGRDFEPGDTANDRYVLIVSQAMARRAWPGESPIGKRVLIDFQTPSGMTELCWTEVVGLVPSTRERTLHGDEPPQAYLPYWSTRFGGNVVLRAAGDPLDLVPAIREAAAELGSGRPIRNVRTIAGYVAEATRETRFVLSTIGVFSGFAVFLAALGVYGVMSQLVSQRRREIGLRMALGARRRDVLRMVLGQGLVLALAGLAAGLAGALALTRVLEGFLFGVTTSDPATFVAVAAFLLLAASAACLLPAARASRVEPATALRYE
jgi:putative ABC transport system permease protein